MAKKKNIKLEARDAAVRFARFISDKGIPVKKLIVFGSYAKGAETAYSDIDVCIVSPRFGKDSVSELQFLLKQTRYIDDRIEPIPVSVKEYKEGFSPLVSEIKKSGKEIKFE